MTITNAGYQVQFIDDIRQELVDAIKENYPDLEFAPESLEGHLVDLMADREYKLNLKFLSLFNNTPKTAFGQSLFSFGFLKGMIPFGEEPSIVTLYFVGNLNANVPVNTLVKDNQGFNYRTINSTILTEVCDNKIFIRFSKVPTSGTWSLTIDDETRTFNFDNTTITTHPYVSSQTGSYLDGFVLTLSLNPETISVAKSTTFDSNVESFILEKDDLFKGSVIATNTTPGAFQTKAYNCNILTTSVTNVQFVFNPENSSEGRNAETNEEFYQRFTETSLANGNSIEGIKNRLLQIINRNQTTDLLRKVKIKTHYGMGPSGAPNPLEVFIAGATTKGEQVATVLRLNLVSAGITLLGDEEFTVKDSEDIEHISRFSRIATKDIYVRMDIEVDGTFETIEEVKEAIVQWGNSLDAGQDVIRIPGLVSSFVGIKGILNVENLELSLNGADYNPENIEIDPFEESAWSIDRIEINII